LIHGPYNVKTSFLFKFQLRTFSVASSIRLSFFRHIHLSSLRTYVMAHVGTASKNEFVNRTNTQATMHKKHEIPSECRKETSYKSLTFNFRQQITPCSRPLLGESLAFQGTPFLLEHEDASECLQEPAICTLKPSQFNSVHTVTPYLSYIYFNIIILFPLFPE
jgi:hypothetical protein